jgi:hypothetical protein
MRQQSMNDIWSCNWHNTIAVHGHIPIITVLAALVGRNLTDNSATAWKNMCQGSGNRFSGAQ